MTGSTDAQQRHVHDKGSLTCQWLDECCILLVICWERSDLLALLYVMFLPYSQITHLTQGTLWETCPYGVLGQVWYLIVWISDLCLLHYFYLMYTYAKFEQNIPWGLKVTQWAFSLKEHDRLKWCSASHCHLFAYFSQKTTDGPTDGKTHIVIIVQTQGSCNT